jgi:pimeloyl-ACP methyl ester carboxylesterase
MPPAAAAPPSCAGYGRETTDLRGLVGSAQPVILVHGWTGQPMQSTRAALERLPSHNRRQFLLYDYRGLNTVWPSDPRVAACLAAYVRDVSETHRERGGNGRVYLVAHSMGGIAIRFALDPAFGGIPELDDRVGGVITIDTPHTGAAWGNSFAAYVLSNVAEIRAGHVPEILRRTVPAPESRAWKCLAGGPDATFAGCATPPELPPSVPLQQLVGEVSVRRTLFGFEAYTMNFGGDVIVPSESQWGGGSGFRMVSCTATGVDLAADYWTLIRQDNAAMDVFSGLVEADVDSAFDALEPLLQGLMGSGCSHTQMPTNARAMALVDEALDDQAKNGGMTLRQLRGRVPVPESCGHPATTVRNGERDFGTDGYAALSLRANDLHAAPVFADLTGNGLKEAVVVFGCSAGGVSWPDWLLIYGNGPDLLGAVSMMELPSTQEHASIRNVELEGDTLRLSWVSYRGASFNPRFLTGTVAQGPDGFELTDVAPDPARFTIGPGTFGDLEVGDSAQELAQEGWVSRSDSEFCAHKWDLSVPSGIWSDFRVGDPDTLDYVGVGWQAPHETVALVRTAEGVGVGTDVRELRRIYGGDLSLVTDIAAEGDPYDAYVLFGSRGALMFAVDPGPFDGASDDSVAAMFAVEGTDLASLRTVTGGC